MAMNPVKSAADLALAPVRLAGSVAGGLMRELFGGGGAAPERPPAPPAPPPARPRPVPKPLDDGTIARKVESAIFRTRQVSKGKVDVNVAEGVVWLRGEVRTPELVRRTEERAASVPEVRSVENLLHLPKTPAPSRTDSPPPQRKTRRSPARPAKRTVAPSKVTEEAPSPPGAEPTPREVAAGGRGRAPAPLGNAEKPGSSANDPGPGPDPAHLDEDPAYQPTDPGLRGVKGG
jgi:hypothetical protein